MLAIFNLRNVLHLECFYYASLHVFIKSKFILLPIISISAFILIEDSGGLNMYIIVQMVLQTYFCFGGGGSGLNGIMF